MSLLKVASKSGLTIAAGYQFDYVFDWTILKYPQIGASSRGRVSACKSFFIVHFHPSKTVI